MSRTAGTPSTVVSVDTGGTFTDLVAFHEGDLRTLKIPSTSDPAEAVLAGLRRLVPEGEPFQLLHGSTVATNALLERTGARVYLVTNEGFEDVIEIGRQNRPQLYALVGHRPPPLVARERRVGVRGRLGPHGEEIEPLDPDLEDRLARIGADAEAVAICLLHAYASPTHEQRVAAALADRGLPLSVSSELLPEYREYERTSTTVVNAYVAPVMSDYLTRLARNSGAERTSVMGSGGGTLPVERATREPVHTILSGPAGGVVGALEWGRRAGYEHVISFDMGGTSTDVAVCPGGILHTKESAIGGQPVALPVIDIHTVGAGGGSIARVDPGGALRVGPRSAGAVPGPIVYGRGGTRVTVTDAHVWLGRLPADGFLGGDAPLDRDAARAPLEALASDLDGSLDDAALGVLEVADVAMERALRVISVERGHDPADFALVGFGGAGGLHVADLASRLGVRRALVPPDPGLLSAFGILAAPLSHESSRTVLREASDDALGDLEEIFRELAEESRAALEAEGAGSDVSQERWVDARYRGQSFELRVPAEGWVHAFNRAHRERYGYERETPVEAVTLRVRSSAPGPRLEWSELPEADGPPPTEETDVHVGHARAAVPRVWREDLLAGHEIEGPLVVLDYSGTTWVPEAWRLSVDRWGTLHLEEM